jgi:hypothetical protein
MPLLTDAGSAARSLELLDRGLPDDLAEWGASIGARSLTPLHAGGSPARVWAVGARDGSRYVVKSLAAGDGLVDGHDLQSFLGKIDQIARVHAELPGLSGSYVRVVRAWRRSDWAAYAMPFSTGTQITDPLRGTRPNVAAFSDDLNGVFRVLTEHGYAARTSPAPDGHFATVHLGRIARRFALLETHLDPALVRGAGAVVNGRRVPSLATLMARVGGDRSLAAGLQPARLHFPVHGDLNLGNLVIGATTRSASGLAFTVLDPRGTTRDWDPVYDFAKSLFSLSVYEVAMQRGFTLRRRTGAGGTTIWKAALRSPQPGYMRAAAGFLDSLDGLPFLADLDAGDPGWRRRLLFTHAFHCLAEAACRLSDRKHRDLGPARGWAACLELASGLLLTGLLLLDDLTRRPADEITLADHLAAARGLTCPR